jgi:hypothetical protein
LLQTPEKIIKKLCHFLEIDFLNEMLNYHKTELQSNQTDGKNAQNLSRPILEKNFNKWKSGLSSREVRVFEAVAGDTLQQYGYEPGMAEPVVNKREKILMKYVEHPLKRLLSLIKNTEGYYEAFKLWRIRIRLIITG